MRDRLYRSRSDRMLFGVAGGMADWLDVDPSIVRLVWALLLFTGVGLLLYIVAAIVIPEEPYEAYPGEESAAAGTTAVAGTDAQSATDTPAGVAPNATWTGPSSRDARRAARRDRAGGGNGAIVLGLILVLAGVWFLAGQLFPAFNGALFWPTLLVILGLVLVVGAMRGRDGGTRP